MKFCPFVTLDGKQLTPLVCLRECGGKDEYCEKHLPQMDQVEAALFCLFDQALTKHHWVQVPGQGWMLKEITSNKHAEPSSSSPWWSEDRS